jgi:predicted acylesterase/phospholipase RssA
MWPGGFEQGLNDESGILDTTPLLNTLIETMAQLGGIIRRKIIVAAVDVNTGDYVSYTEQNTDSNDFAQRALASSSIPFIFPHQHIGNRVLMDGGTVWNTNLKGAVDRCMEQVSNHSQITMDIIVCSSESMDVINATGNTVDNFLRYWTISTFHWAMADVVDFMEAYPNVNYRYFFKSTKPLA